MIDNNNGTITNKDSGLMWQQETPEKMTWDQAETYCKNLNLGGYTDWRLPTIQELLSMVDYTRYIPAIDTNYFPYTASSFYWSSTVYCDLITNVWGVDFYNGISDYYYKLSSYYVRAVRNILEV